jgi:membrane fusion protein, multidrug efflux system
LYAGSIPARASTRSGVCRSFLKTRGRPHGAATKRWRPGVKTKRMIIMLAIVGVILGGVFGFQAFKGMMMQKYMAAMGAPAQTVSTAVATMQEWNASLEAVGSIRAVTGADLSTDVAGIVEEIHFDSGQDVKAGTLLVKLRAGDDLAKLRSLEASAELAETTYQRATKLLQQQFVAQATVDAAEANLTSAKAAVAEQKALVDKKLIRAPFDGRLGIRQVDVGQYVAAGTPIVTLQTLDPIYLDFYLPQDALAQIETGQSVLATTNTYPGQEFQGRLSAINSKVEETTRNVAVRVKLANPEHVLLPGMYATARIAVGAPQSYLTLPQTAITYNPYGDTVFVVEEKAPGDGAQKQMVAVQRFVTLGPTRGDQVAVLSGLTEGDTVVTSGQIKLQNGSPVTINNAVQPADQAEPAPSDQ